MAGTILKQFSAIPQSDGTTVTTGNSGLTSISIGAGNTLQFQSAAAMGQSAGYRANQTGANQITTYMDLDGDVTIFAFRIPFRFQTVPATQVTFLRFYPDTAHGTGGSLNLTTSRRISFVEPDSGLNVTSPSGTPLVAGTSYIIQGLVNLTTDFIDIRVYEVGSESPLCSVSGNLTTFWSTNTVVRSIRWGVGTASAGLGNLDTNDGWAIGSGDWLARYDISVPLDTPVVTLGAAVQPTYGNSDGSQIVAWSAIDGATSYSAHIADGPSPEQGAFNLVEANVTSPYTFTNLPVGVYSYGIRAEV